MLTKVVMKPDNWKEWLITYVPYVTLAVMDTLVL